MPDVIAVALISLIGTLCGTFGGIMTSSKLTGYRIEQLEGKVDKLEGKIEKYNDINERVLHLEDNDKRLEEKITSIISRLN